MILANLLLLALFTPLTLTSSPHSPHHRRSHLSSLAPSITKRSFSGTATYFEDGLGACGQYNTPSDFIVALNAPQYTSGSYCFQTVTITAANGRTLSAQVADECPGCGWGSLDMSQGLFEAFGYSTGDGTFGITWDFGGSVQASTTEEQHTSTSETPTSTWVPPTTTSTTTSATKISITASSTKSLITSTATLNSTSLPTGNSTSVLSTLPAGSATAPTAASAPTPSPITPDTNGTPGTVDAVSNLEMLGGVVAGLGRLVVLLAGGT